MSKEDQTKKATPNKEEKKDNKNEVLLSPSQLRELQRLIQDHKQYQEEKNKK